MKKRIVSFICVVAVLATMLSIGLINTFAGSAAVADGEVIKIDDTFTPADWTSSSGSSWTWDGGAGTLTAPELNNSAIEELTYKTAYDFSGGFSIAYSSKGNKSRDNYYLNSLYETVKLGNIQVGLTPVSIAEPKSLTTANMTADDGVALFIKVGDNIVAKDFIITKDKNYHANATKLSHAWKLYYYYTYTDIDKFAYTVDYDAAAKTVIATLKYDGAQIATATYTDTANAVNVADAKFSLASANSYKQNPTYANLSVKGVAPAVSSVPASSEPASSEPASSEPASSVGIAVTVGEAVKIIDTFTASDWTSGNGGRDWTFSNGVLTAPKANNKSEDTLTYNTKFNFTEGFDISFNSIPNKSNDNYYLDCMYTGVKVGNVKFGLVAVSETEPKSLTTANMTANDGVKLAIFVDDAIVATSDFIITKDKNYHTNATKLSHAWKLFYYYTYSDLSSMKFTLKYDATAKTVVGVMSYGGAELGKVTYNDTDSKLNLTEAEFALASNDCYNMMASYSNVIVKGKADSTESEPEAVEKGQAITAVIETELTAADWDGDTACIQSDGTFFIKSKTPKFITSKAKYDFSQGFEFKSNLVMKNGYTNYYGEWCSVYFGNTATGLELRIKNIEGQGLYTAHLLYEGSELASYDLANLPNGEYAVSYKDGKVVVTLDGVAIGWKLSDNSTSTSVAVNLDKLVNDTISYKIEGNYHNTDRYWKGFRLAPVGAQGGANGSTGDLRNIVIPAVVLVVSAIAAAFVATRKKSKA